MKDAQRMRRLQPVRNLDAHRENQLYARRSAFDELVQRLAGHVLHGDVGLFAAFAHLVDAAHIGMLDGRRQPRLAQHRGAHLFGRQRAGVQHLQHHRPLQQRVIGLVDHTAAAGAQPSQNLVMCNGFTLHRSPQVYRPSRKDRLKGLRIAIRRARRSNLITSK